MSNSTHHPYGPSRMKALQQCPGVIGDPDADMSAADEGTQCHAAAETGDLTGLTDEQVHAVETATEYVRDLAATLPGCEIHTETLLEVAGINFGTADVVLVQGLSAHLIDYKFGRRSVPPAEWNLQGWNYTVGVFDRWPAVQAVTVHFLLPRRDEVSTATFFRAQREDLYAPLAAIVQQAQKYEATGDATLLCPSTDVCRWCGRKGECPALSAPCTDLATRANGGLTMPTETHPGLMTAPQLAQALEVASIVEAWVDRWVKAVKAEGVRRVKAGDAELSAGYKIQRRAGRREVSDPIKASAILAGEFGFTAEEMGAVTRLSLSDAEKLVASKAGRGNGKAAVERLSDLLETAGLLSRKPDSEYVTAIE